MCISARLRFVFPVFSVRVFSWIVPASQHPASTACFSLPICSINTFIDSYITQSNLPSEPLPEPMDVFALNGRLLARVTHRTVPVPLLLSGNHHKTISLYIIPSPISPLVLGLPWLKLHNPHIDWCTSSITNWSLFCHSHCCHHSPHDSNHTVSTQAGRSHLCPHWVL